MRDVTSKQLALAWLWKTTQPHKVNPEPHELAQLYGGEGYDAEETQRFINEEVAKLHKRAADLLSNKDLLEIVKKRSQGI